MKQIPAALAALLVALLATLRADADEGITWLVSCDGKSLPAAPWIAVGNPKATIEADGLRLNDDDKDFANYRATWKAGVDDEIIVEAKIKARAITGSQPKKPATSLWPWRDSGYSLSTNRSHKK